MLVIAGFASIMMVNRARDLDNHIATTLQTHRAVNDVLSAMQDAETGQRGYLLTGDLSYLEPYRASETQLPAAVDNLRELLKGNPERDSIIASLTSAIDGRVAHLRSGIELMQRGAVDEARQRDRLSGGKVLMDKVRDLLEQLSQGKMQQLAEDQARASSLRDWLIVLIGVALTSAALMALFVGRTLQHYISRLHRRTEELENEVKLRLVTEGTLRQAQKMEAIGQLTGGLAHDFNNLLTIVIGNLDTMRRRLANAAPDEDASHLRAILTKPVDLAMQGSRSAAQLTHRLLAFSRRQALEPRHVDLNRLVAGMSDLLRRTLGEGISVETVLAGGLWSTYADANQVENALLNLVVNARDAMPEGGRLTIETANAYLDEAYARHFGDVEPGQYVLLSVTDTGSGITPDLMERVFEPFFTTKDTGRGSGLGLAMVHGFVKQSEGHVRVYSEVGEGTTVKIYLPRSNTSEQAQAHPAGDDSAADPLPRARAKETLLVVEDNDGVREYAISILEDLGYAVIEASNVAEALQKMKSAPKIDLLFTDVVLPGGANGRVLADKLLAVYPKLPILFTTGNTRNAIVHHGRLDANVHLLQKPYTQQELARKLRELLDGAKRKKP